jgi:hypothetical protein
MTLGRLRADIYSLDKSLEHDLLIQQASSLCKTERRSSPKYLSVR